MNSDSDPRMQPHEDSEITWVYRKCQYRLDKSNPSGSNPSSDDTNTNINTDSTTQQYSWVYMTSTLDACFKEAEHAAQNDLKTHSEELDEEQETISDQQVWYEAEREIQFYNELASDKVTNLVSFMLMMLTAQLISTYVLEAQALSISIASKDLSGSEIDYDSMDLMLREYDDVLDRLGSLLMETFELESAILRLMVSSSAPKLEDEYPPDSDETEEQPAESSSLEPEAPQLLVSSSSSVKIATEPALDSKSDTETETSPTGTTPSSQPQDEAEPRSQIAPQLVEGAKQNLRVTVASESMGIEGRSDGEEEDYDDEKGNE
ncbi:hypothetical protein GYMLUDRAFT_240737 [Collybiopsis luxurians FD-317 M1]|nr:hypothetical protein GYMLUDRAFT_240737 [Collybiopsis luxurians FD-317 M1]